MHRFRLRVVFQNISNYSTLFIGIFFAAVIVIFSLMFGPLLDDYSTMVGKSVIAKYQYALKAPVTTKVKDAEKYCVESLKTLPGKYMEDEITIYGVQKNSNYIKADIPAGEVLVSNGYWEKFGVKKGDKITLKDPYSKKKYTFKVAGYYTYDAVLAVFMNNDDFCDTFDKEKDYYSGYFSKKKLKDIPKEYVASVITVKDLRKVSTQLKVSMGNYMELLQIFRCDHVYSSDVSFIETDHRKEQQFDRFNKDPWLYERRDRWIIYYYNLYCGCIVASFDDSVG